MKRVIVACDRCGEQARIDPKHLAAELWCAACGHVSAGPSSGDHHDTATPDRGAMTGDEGDGAVGTSVEEILTELRRAKEAANRSGDWMEDVADAAAEWCGGLGSVLGVIVIVVYCGALSYLMRWLFGRGWLLSIVLGVVAGVLVYAVPAAVVCHVRFRRAVRRVQLRIAALAEHAQGPWLVLNAIFEAPADRDSRQCLFAAIALRSDVSPVVRNCAVCAAWSCAREAGSKGDWITKSWKQVIRKNGIVPSGPRALRDAVLQEHEADRRVT